jgi:hypothetical protein
MIVGAEHSKNGAYELRIWKIEDLLTISLPM